MVKKKWQKEKCVVECCTDSPRDVVFLVFWFVFFWKRALTWATDPAAPPTGGWEWNKSALQLLECKTSRRANKTAWNSDPPQISCTKRKRSHRNKLPLQSFALILSDEWNSNVILSWLMQILPCICTRFFNYYIQIFMFYLYKIAPYDVLTGNRVPPGGTASAFCGFDRLMQTFRWCGLCEARGVVLGWGSCVVDCHCSEGKLI